jgi:hypothetical protein
MTKYYAIFKFHGSGKVERLEFDSMTERALAIIGYGLYADVLEQGQC